MNDPHFGKQLVFFSDVLGIKKKPVTPIEVE